MAFPMKWLPEGNAMGKQVIVQQALVGAIRRSSIFNPEIQVKPACILWSDRDHQREAIIP